MGSRPRQKAKRRKGARRRGGSPAAGARLPGLSEAIAHYEAGRLEEAERLCKRLVDERPGALGPLHILGVIAHQGGDDERAAVLLGRVVDADGANAVYCHHLAEVQRSRGCYEAAIEAYRRALRLDPNQPDACYGLGNALFELHRFDEAAAAYRRGVELDPDDPELHNNLGNTLAETGDLPGAIACYRDALRLRPAHVDAWLNLGRALTEQGRLEDALHSYRCAVRTQPDSVPALLGLGDALRRSGRHEAAIESYRRALALAPERAEAYNNLGYCLAQLGRSAEAMTHFEKALALQPQLAEAHANSGMCLQNQGRFGEAVAAYRHAIRLKPDFADAYLNLLNNKTYRVTDEDIRRITELLEGEALSPDARISLSFALGGAYEDRGECDAAFGFYHAANALKAERVPFDADRHTDYIHRVIETFGADFFAQRKDFGIATELPVFIVGMPRSGSSLVEQIMASHPAVFGAGELHDIRLMVGDLPKTVGTSRPFPECAAHLERQVAHRLAERYLRALERQAGAALRATDKMLGNYLRLGLIAVMFPRARVIHCRRDPLDTCLSCYFQNFATGLRFTYDLRHLGIAYRSYEKLMAHWREVLPLEMLDVQYEALIEDQEAMSRRLIEFLGLPWDDRCLAFHAQQREVRTASFWQVRQPLYASSVGRWRRYEQHLGPLMQALGRSPERAR